MCSISGIYRGAGVDAGDVEAAERMSRTMRHRGPDGEGTVRLPLSVLCHNRLAVMDQEGGAQPMERGVGHDRYVVVYNGEIYNGEELRAAFRAEGIVPTTHCDTELLLYAYALWGEAAVERLEGIFAFAVYDRVRDTLFCARDRMGVKPFFYYEEEGRFYFASELKALFAVKRPTVGREGLWQLLFLSPVTLPGTTVFEGIRQLGAGECLTVSAGQTRRRTYWRPPARRLDCTREEAVAHTRTLLEGAIRRQLVADVPLCSFLSGGLDSSVVSSVGASALRGEGRQLDTWSFAYEGNREAYKPSLLQPASDDSYAALMADYIGSCHRVLTIPTEALADALEDATLARDFPGQADIDSSLLWFCRQIKKTHTVALSGECADEIFGGYPWFYRPEMLEREFFPWIHQPMGRAALFRADLIAPTEGYAYLSEQYRRAVSEASVLESDSPSMRTSRIASHLSMTFFMASLLERKDRMSMATGLEVRVPFADHHLVEFVYNVPWEYKFHGAVEKSLLRDAMAPYLPDAVRERKKSPYPKTHNRAYEELVYRRLCHRLASPHSRLRPLLDARALDALTAGEDGVWFGQLMARAQLYAWLYQMDLWLERYDVTLSL